MNLFGPNPAPNISCKASSYAPFLKRSGTSLRRDLYARNIKQVFRGDLDAALKFLDLSNGMLRAIVCVFFIISCQVLEAQTNRSFVHYTTQDGLPDGNIGCITQDSYGFMWIGTNDGLCRFDGKEFLVFRRGERNRSISGNNITSIQEDDQKRLWIGSADGGVCYYDLGAQEFKWFDDTEIALTSKNVTNMDYSSGSGLLYITWNNGGLFAIDTKNLDFQRVEVFENDSKLTYYDVLCDSKGFTYCSPVGRRLCVLRGKELIKTDTTIYYPNPAHTISCFQEANDGKLWCGAWDPNLHLIDPATGELESFEIKSDFEIVNPQNEILSISLDNDGKIWCGTLDGLYIFNRFTKTFDSYRHQNKDPQSLISSKINCIFKDNRNRMWLGTDSGLSIYDPQSNQFQIEWFSEDENCRVNDIFEIDETLYLGTSCGLFAKKRGLETFHEIESKYEGEQLQITNFFMDSRRRVFVGSNKTLFLLDTISQKLQTIDGIVSLSYLDFYNISSSQINSIVEFPFRGSNSIWIEIFGHLVALFDFQNLEAIPSFMGELAKYENLINKFFVDSKDNLWILGRSHGLMLYVDQPELNKIGELLNPKMEDLAFENYFLKCRFVSEEKKLPFSDVTDMVELHGKYFVSTNGYGLYSMTTNNGVFQLNHVDGSPNVIRGMIKDHNGKLWLINNSGLILYHPLENEFLAFNSSDGLPLSGIRGKYINSLDGQIHIGGMGHVISFHPNQVLKNIEIPSIHFTHFRVADESMDYLLRQEFIKLSHDQNYISVTCASLSYTAPEKNMFMYRLVGLDQEWHQNGTNHIITYNSLPPGTYELHVKGSNSDGLWNEESKILKFLIMPPFYLRWWFFVLIFAAVLSILYLLYRYRIRQIIAMQNLRNNIARDLHDEVGSTLGSISLYSEAARQQLEESHKDQVQDIIRRIGENSREMIEKMSDIVWSVNPGKDSMEHLISRMESFASGILGTSQVGFSVKCTQGLYAKSLNLDERKNLFLIFKEAVYNSLKYSGCSFVDTQILEDSGHIKMIIADDGKGFDVSNLKTHNGNGLKNMKSRAEEIGGNLTVESGEQGTRIQFQFKKK